MSFLMNYIIPEGFDFYKELKSNIETESTENNEHIDEEEDNQTCLISGEKIEKDTSITLECGHTFNYNPLFMDLSNYKQPGHTNYSYSDNLHLNEHQIRCPYCRQVQQHILPYLPDIQCRRVRGVNYPPSLSMGKNFCSYVFKSGKNKNQACGKRCFREMCNQHYKPKIHLADIELSRDELIKFTMTELKKLAKFHKIKGFSTLKKNDLINLLVNNK